MMPTQFILGAILLIGASAIKADTLRRSASLGTDNRMSGIHVTGDGPFECHYEFCPSGWSRHSYSKCIKIIQTPATHAEAEVECRALNSTLAVVGYDNERKFYNSLAMRDAPTNQGLWLGMKRKGLLWFTSDLTPYYNIFSWAPGHPDFTVGFCVTLLSEESLVYQPHWGTLAMADCGERLMFACQRNQYYSDKIVCGPR